MYQPSTVWIKDKEQTRYKLLFSIQPWYLTPFLIKMVIIIYQLQNNHLSNPTKQKLNITFYFIIGEIGTALRNEQQ